MFSVRSYLLFVRKRLVPVDVSRHITEYLRVPKYPYLKSVPIAQHKHRFDRLMKVFPVRIVEQMMNASATAFPDAAEEILDRSSHADNFLD